MGLIARALEAEGIPTLCMASALSIIEAVRPPRAVFVDFPLGHTSGKPFDTAQQDDLLARALQAFDAITTPGEVLRFDDCWGDDAHGDDWKLPVLDPDGDDRTERRDTPQYQHEADRERAELAMRTDGCPTCVWVADTR